MICESCGERPATTLIRKVADGILRKLTWRRMGHDCLNSMLQKKCLEATGVS